MLLRHAVRSGPLLAVGASSLIWQVACARAVLSGLRGSELAIGLVLGSWLLLFGLGAALSVRVPRIGSHPLVGLAISLALTPVGLLVSLALQRALLPVFDAAGQVMDPLGAVWVSLACLAPACLLFGASFGLASLRPHGAGGVAPWSARVYLAESVGTAAAAVLFHLWLARVDLQVAALAASVPVLAAAIGLFVARGRTGGIWRVLVGPSVLLGAAATCFLFPGIPAPWRDPPSSRIPGYEVLAQENSRQAALLVLQREDQRLFLANGQVLFTNQDDRQAESSVHPILLAHPAPRTILLIGGGLGGGLREVLAHGPVEQVDYVELDAAVLALARRWGGKRLSAVLGDRRVRLLVEDGRRVVARSPGRYDLIMVGLPGPSSALVNRFFTEQFFISARRALRPGGALQVSLEGSETYLGDEMALVHSTVRSTMKRVFGQVAALPGGRTLLLSGRDRAPDLRGVTLMRRFALRSLAPRTFNRGELMNLTLPFKREAYDARIGKVAPLTNTDLHPTVYFHASLQWVALSVPGLARSMGRLAALCGRSPWLLPLAGLALSLAWCGVRRRRGAPAFSIAVAGLTGLSMELCFLLATQEIRGVVYHEIGVMLGAFMVGLAGGAMAGKRLAAAFPRRSLQLGMAACGLASLAGIATLQLAIAAPDLGLILLLTNMALVGVSVGACFPPAAAALSGGRGETAAARAYAWDLTGAAIGALLTSGFVLPLAGLENTCFLCAALCLGCAAWPAPLRA